MFRFDPNYRTKTVPRWGRMPIGAGLGLILALLGILSAIFSIVNLCLGRATDDKLLGKNLTFIADVPPVLSENPFWPAAGKGIWVGFIMFATGVMGIISYIDGTLASIKAFTALAGLNAVFSCYLFITSILPLSTYNGQNTTDNFRKRTRGAANEYVLDSLLLTAGLISMILSFLAMIVGLGASGYCSNGRTRIARPGGPFGPRPRYGVRPRAIPVPIR